MGYYNIIKITILIRCICLIGLCNFSYASSVGYAKFAVGNCTEYVAQKRPDLFPSAHGKDRAFGGDAKHRLTNAKRVNIPTGTHAEQGAIAVFAPGKGATSHGHVAIVEEIYDDGTILISDMNYTGWNQISYRVIDPSIAIGYIYDTTPKEEKRSPYIAYLNNHSEIDSTDVGLHLALNNSYREGENNNIISISYSAGLNAIYPQQKAKLGIPQNYTILFTGKDTVQHNNIENIIGDIYSDYDLLI